MQELCSVRAGSIMVDELPWGGRIAKTGANATLIPLDRRA